MNEKDVAVASRKFSAKIIYRIGGEEKTHFFGPFPNQEDLQTAIIAHERSLEYSHRYNWEETARKFSPPSPADV